MTHANNNIWQNWRNEQIECITEEVGYSETEQHIGRIATAIKKELIPYASDTEYVEVTPKRIPLDIIAQGI